MSCRRGALLLLLLMVRGLTAQAPAAPLQQAFWTHRVSSGTPDTRARASASRTQSSAVRGGSRWGAKSAVTTSSATTAATKASAPTQASSPEALLAAAAGKAGDPSTPWAIVIGLTLLTLLPAILLSMTPMVRLLVVFHFLRQALGTQTAPSNQVLMGLSLVMTWFLMQPVLLQVDQAALTPYRSGEITASMAIDRGEAPVKAYMLRYARQKDLALFVEAAHMPRPTSAAALPMAVVVPAYILSELKAGFGIGAVLFLPFLLIDFLVASVTTSVGMLQLSPAIISTPIKILLFVIVDGWSLLADQLLKSF